MKKLIVIFLILYSSKLLSNDYKIDIHGKIVSNEKHKYSDNSYFSILKILGLKISGNISNNLKYILRILLSLSLHGDTCSGPDRGRSRPGSTPRGLPQTQL